MPDGGTFEYIAAEVIEDIYAIGEAVEAYAAYIEVAMVVAASYMSYEAQVRARNAYNASLRDRYVMQRTSTGQRALVLGRARVSGPIAFMQSYGTNQSTLAIVVVFAAHECDAIEKVYFNDQVVSIDAAGNVVGVLSTEHFSVDSSTASTVFLAVPAILSSITATVTYADTSYALTTTLASDNMHLTMTGARAGQVGDVKVTYQPITCQYTPSQVADSVYQTTATATSGSYTFPAATAGYVQPVGRSVISALATGLPSAASVVVVQVASGVQKVLASTCVVDALGHASSVSWTGATVGAAIKVTYQSTENASRARIRLYTGAPGQVADAQLIANLPGEWTANHVGNGLCYAVCEFDFDQSSYSAGLPNVSATVRGAKVLDPRSGALAWSENPAILARAYWTHSLGANQPASTVDDNAVFAAANTCDNITYYLIGPVQNPLPATAPLYTAGYVATKDMKPQDALTDLCMAMGGRWVINGNVLRVRAGAYASPVAAIDASWLTGESSVRLQPLPARQTLFNSAQGTFCDETNDYRAVQYPKQSATSIITADGRELPLDITYQAVTKIAQAQYLSACAIRYNRAGMTVQLSCNLKAFALEVFDVVTLTLSRFGFIAQAFEVTDTSFTPDGLIQLTLKFIDPSIWALDASYQLTAYAPKTVLPAPWMVQVPTIGVVLTGSSQMLQQADGTIVSRIYVPITSTDPTVIVGGWIDIAYLDAADDVGNWNTITVAGAESVGVYLAPVKDGHNYLIKARARNTLFSSDWSATISSLVVGSTAAPTGVSGLAYSVSGGNVYITWNPNTDSDYKQTVIQYGPPGTSGNAWGGASMTQAFAGAANSYQWPSPGAGTYEFQVRHYNFSGNATNSSTLYVIAPYTTAQLLTNAGSTAVYSNVTGAPVDSTNMVLTPVFDNVRGIRTWQTGSVVAVSGQTWAYALSTTTRDTLQTVGLPVVAGETLYFRASMNASGATQTFNFGGYFADATGAFIAPDVVVGLPAGTSGWQTLSGQLVVPAGATAVFPWAQLNGTSGASGTGLITNMYVGRTQPSANATFVDAFGTVQGVLAGSGTQVANSLLTATIADKISASAGGVLYGTVSLGATAGAGFVAGSLTWDASGNRTGGYGVAMTPKGIAGYNAAGVATFTLDASTGDAYFGGTLRAGTVTTGTTTGTGVSGVTTGSGVSSLNSGSVGLVSMPSSGNPVEVSINVNVRVQCNTNPTVYVQVLPTVDGNVVSVAGHTPEYQQDLSNAHIVNPDGGTTYNWGFTQNFDWTFSVTPSAGTHTYGVRVYVAFYGTTGSPNTITGATLGVDGMATTREFLA